MSSDLKAKIDKLIEGIKSHPALHTRSHSFGACIYDTMILADEGPHYVRIAFDVHPKTGNVVILDMQCVESSGPH